MITGDVKLDLHGDRVGQSAVPEQLVGLLQGPVLSGGPVDGQQPVPHLQEATPTHTHTHTIKSSVFITFLYLLHLKWIFPG